MDVRPYSKNVKTQKKTHLKPVMAYFVQKAFGRSFTP